MASMRSDRNVSHFVDRPHATGAEHSEDLVVTLSHSDNVFAHFNTLSEPDLHWALIIPTDGQSGQPDDCASTEFCRTLPGTIADGLRILQVLFMENKEWPPVEASSAS